MNISKYRIKKTIGIMLMFLLALTTVACGETQDGNTSLTKSATALKVGEKYTVDGYAEFELYKIQTTNEVTGSVDSTTVYTAPDGSEYVDMILEITNISPDAINSENFVSVKATSTTGTNYTCDTFIVEEGNGTSIDSYTDIPPLTKVKLHCATEVNPNEDQVTLKLDVKGEKYTYDYILTDTVRDAKTIKKGDVLEEDDFAKLELKGAEYTDDLMPSNTSGFYNHYPISNTDNTYLVVKFKITNLQSSARDVDSFIGVKAIYKDKYSYTGSVVEEEKDGTGFSSYEDLSPLSEYKLFAMIEVPKSIIDNDAVIEISFGGKEYLYSYSK